MFSSPSMNVRSLMEEVTACMCIGVRTANNCYGITPSISNKCFSVKNQVDLWHQLLGHASHKQLEKISKCDAVIGLPRFEKIEKCMWTMSNG